MESYNRSKWERFDLFSFLFFFFFRCRITRCHSKTEIPCRRTLFDERCTISNNLHFSRCGIRFIIYIPTIRYSYESSSFSGIVSLYFGIPILKILLDLEDINREELNIFGIIRKSFELRGEINEWSNILGYWRNRRIDPFYTSVLFKLSNLITSPLFQFQNSSRLSTNPPPFPTITTRLFLLSDLSSTSLSLCRKKYSKAGHGFRFKFHDYL